MPDDGIFAVGGLGSEPRLWDVARPDVPIFKAKCLKVGAKELYIQSEKMIADLAFVPGHGGTQFVGCTLEREVRLYDTRAQARPVYNVSNYFISFR